MSERVRTTISVDADVLATFKKLADLGEISVSRFIGDWLADTADGAQHVAIELLRAKEASKGLLRGIHMQLGVGDVRAMVSAPEDATRSTEPREGGAARPEGSGHGAPSSNTGLKVGRQAKKVAGGNA